MPFPDVGDTARNRDITQAVAERKRPLPNIGDGAGNRDARRVVIRRRAGQRESDNLSRECVVPYADNRQTVDIGWNVHRPDRRRSGVTGDGKRNAIGVCCVSELGGQGGCGFGCKLSTLPGQRQCSSPFPPCGRWFKAVRSAQQRVGLSCRSALISAFLIPAPFSRFSIKSPFVSHA